MRPEGNDGIVWVSDEDDRLAIAKGQVRHPEADRLPPPVPPGNLVLNGDRGTGTINRGVPVLRFLGKQGEKGWAKALFLEPKNRIKPKINRTEPEPRAKHNANSSNRTKPKVKFMQPTLYDKSI